MGTMGAMGMAEAVDEGMIGLRSALSWHLTANHFPPIDVSFIDTAVEAISCVDSEDYDTEITMPNGLVRTASQIVEGMHLESFLGSEALDFDADDEVLPEEGDGS